MAPSRCVRDIISRFCSEIYGWAGDWWTILLAGRLPSRSSPGRRAHQQKRVLPGLFCESLESRSLLAVSANLAAGLLTINVDSTDANNTAFVRFDSGTSNYIVSTTSGGVGILIAGGPSTTINTTAITVAGAAAGTESVFFEGATNFVLTGALNVAATVENAVINRSLSFASATIGANAVTAVNAGNTITATAGAVSIDSGTVTLAAGLTSNTADVNVRASTGALAVNGAVTANSGSVRLNAAGNISQTAVITASALGVRTTAGNVDLTLAGNNVATFAAANTVAGGTVKYRDADAVALGSVATVGSFTGATGVTTNAADVTLVSGALSIGQVITAGTGTVRLTTAGGVSQTAAITASSLGVRNATSGNVDLTLVGNNVVTFAANNTVAGGTVKYRDADALAIGTVTLDGALFTPTTNGVTTNAADVTFVTGGALSIGQAVNAGSGTVRLSTAGGVSQTAAITAAALGVRNITGGNVDLTLATNNVATFAANNVVAAGTVKYRDADALAIGSVSADGTLFTPTTNGITTTTGDVTLVTGGALSIGQAVAVGTGTVRLTTAGGVTQTAAITAATLGVRNATSGNVDLSLATNNVTTFAANNAVAGGTVKYQDADALTIGTVTLDGTLFTPTTSGVTTNAADITIVTAGALSISDAIGAGTGAVRLTTAGGVSQIAAITASALGVRNSTSGNVDLTLATNNVAAFAANNAVAGGTVKYRDADAVALGIVTADGVLFTPTTSGVTTNSADVTLVSGGALSIGQAITAGTGTVRLTTAGGVSQTAVITASALGVRNATAGNIDLTLAGNNVATFAANNAVAGGTVKYRDADALAIGTVTLDGTLFTPTTSGVTANAADVTIVTGGALSIGQAIGASGATVRLTTSGGVSQTAAITASSLGVRNTTVGNVDLTLATNNVATFAANNAVAGGTVKYRDADAVALGIVTADGVLFTPTTSGVTTNSADVTLVSGGALSIGQAITAGTGTVRLTTAGGVSQTAVITASALGVRNATAGNIDLTLAGNNVATFAANNAVAGGTVKYRDADALAIGTVTLDGTLFTPTTSGVTANAADVTIVTGGVLSINQAIGAGTATIRLATSGAISQTAAGILTATFLGARTTAGNIDLSLAANQINTFAGDNSAAGGTFKLRNDASLTVGSIGADGALFGITSGVTTSNADITLASFTHFLTVNFAVSAGSGTVRLRAESSITQSGGGVITASALGVSTTADTIVLTNPANNVATLAMRNTYGVAGGVAKYRDADGVAVGTVSADGALFRDDHRC